MQQSASTQKIMNSKCGWPQQLIYRKELEVYFAIVQQIHIAYLNAARTCANTEIIKSLYLNGKTFNDRISKK